MDQDIARFLAAGDLDTALTAVDSVAEISRDDAAALTDVIVAWTDAQAVANMLMYPTIIPAQHRVAAVLRGLATDFREYPSVAAVVGLRRYEMPDEYRRAVGQRLVDLCGCGAEPMSSLASATLATYIDDVDIGTLLMLFDDFGQTSRHNTLVGLIAGLGAADLRKHVDRVRANEMIRGTTATEIDERLDVLEAQGGGSLLFARIPDLAEWTARPSPAAYPGA